jgi:Helix-turn-helix family
VNRQPALARRFFDRFEPVHGITYFAPESRQAMDDLGYRGFWMGYFATRSAPFGQVAAPVVAATFYNFSPARVAKALPAAWSIAPPEDALRIRLESAVAALRRYGVADDENLRTAAELCAKAATAAPVDGRPLFAANSALPWPGEPIEKLWHAATLLREHRGDGHIAALVTAGVRGRESNVLHCAAGRVPVEFIRRTRDYGDDEWQQCTESLTRRGLLTPEDALTDAGHELKDRVEARTDAAALSALDGLTDDEIETLFRALTPITRLVVAGGDLPAKTPMGLRRDELDDDSAHLD